MRKLDQINGLAVLGIGEYAFGKPSRITANTYLGRAGVVNIERETKMVGLHSKGVLTLSGYLGNKYAQKIPLSLTASLTFEQLYEGIDGDSAACSAELYTILSSLSGVPLRQDIAVTGLSPRRVKSNYRHGVTEKYRRIL